jgi:hypothetical protein
MFGEMGRTRKEVVEACSKISENWSWIKDNCEKPIRIASAKDINWAALKYKPGSLSFRLSSSV